MPKISRAGVTHEVLDDTTDVKPENESVSEAPVVGEAGPELAELPTGAEVLDVKRKRGAK